MKCKRNIELHMQMLQQLESVDPSLGVQQAHPDGIQYSRVSQLCFSTMHISQDITCVVTTPKKVIVMTT